MEKASQKYREVIRLFFFAFPLFRPFFFLKKKTKQAPDVYFRDAHKIIVRIVTNIVSDPEEAKFRQINMKGKAFHSVAEAAGAVDVLLFLGFRVEGDFLTLPPGREIDPASLDFLLRIEEIREQEKMEREAKKAAKASKEKEQKSKAMQEKVVLLVFYFVCCFLKSFASLLWIVLRLRKRLQPRASLL